MDRKKKWIDPQLEQEIKQLQKNLEEKTNRHISFREATKQLARRHRKTKDNYKKLRYLLSKKPKKKEIEIKIDPFNLEG